MQPWLFNVIQEQNQMCEIVVYVFVQDVLVFKKCSFYVSDPQHAMSVRNGRSTTRTCWTFHWTLFFTGCYPFGETLFVKDVFAFEYFRIGTFRLYRSISWGRYAFGWFQAHGTMDIHSNVGARQNMISPKLATLYLNINGKFCFK